ncbi:hypothetical protein [Alkalicoccobacillus gibsonii]|uniref:hypothetical protein n=1 Tax=Alkalicoccobacillus gibsonii TaxID=79881 RepID=UPI003518607D
MRWFILGILFYFLAQGFLRWLGVPFGPGDLLRGIIGEPTPIKSAIVILVGVTIFYLTYRSVRHKMRENAS